MFDISGIRYKHKVQPRYKRKFELSEFDITRFNCTTRHHHQTAPVHLHSSVVRYAVTQPAKVWAGYCGVRVAHEHPWHPSVGGRELRWEHTPTELHLAGHRITSVMVLQHLHTHAASSYWQLCLGIGRDINALIWYLAAIKVTSENQIG